MILRVLSSSFFFFNATATTEIYTLSLHDALPISSTSSGWATRSRTCCSCRWRGSRSATSATWYPASRSEEHTSELQSQFHLVCRLLLEKKKNKKYTSQLYTSNTNLLVCWIHISIN